jgi:hypothetical protein
MKGMIAQTLVPKKGGGRVAALEVLIVTPAISNLIREGKTFQIPSSMQTGRNYAMVMLNEALFDLVKSGTVEPLDAYIKAVDKTGFESLLSRGGFRNVTIPSSQKSSGVGSSNLRAHSVTEYQRTLKNSVFRPIFLALRPPIR